MADDIDEAKLGAPSEGPEPGDELSESVTTEDETELESSEADPEAAPGDTGPVEAGTDDESIEADVEADSDQAEETDHAEGEGEPPEVEPATDAGSEAEEDTDQGEGEPGRGSEESDTGKESELEDEPDAEPEAEPDDADADELDADSDEEPITNSGEPSDAEPDAEPDDAGDSAATEPDAEDDDAGDSAATEPDAEAIPAPSAITAFIDRMVPAVEEAKPEKSDDQILDSIDASVPAMDLPEGVFSRFKSGAAVKYNRTVLDDPDRYDRVPGEGKSRSKRRTVVVFLVLMLVLAAVVVFATYRMELWGGKSVPMVSGQTQELASMNIREHGFEVKVQEDIVDGEGGKVLSTDPAEGTRIDPGSTVTLHVGVSRVIPKVRGLSSDDAQQALRDMGARRISLSYMGSSEPAGTVIGVEPEQGRSFTTDQEVKLTIAQAFTVPYVVGQEEEEVTKSLTDQGFKVNVTYIKTDKQDKGKVLDTDPKQGTTIEAGATITLKVSAVGPIDYHHLLEYHDYSPQDIANYLDKQDFDLQSNYAENNELYALYASTNKGSIVFSPKPYSHTFDSEKDVAETDFLSSGQKFDGIRLDIPVSDLPADANTLSDGALQAIMDRCGFKDPLQKVNQDSIALPAGAQKNGTAFTCAYGEENGYYWTVLIANEGGGTRATATVAPKALYDGVDLTGFDGSVCSMVAYSDVYAQ